MKARKPAPAMRGRRRTPSDARRGGRRHTDPRRSGMWVAILEVLNPGGSSMADDLKQTGTPDDQRFNPEQDHELAYWSEKLGVSRDELREAVQSAGPMVKDVQRHLNR